MQIKKPSTLSVGVGVGAGVHWQSGVFIFIIIIIIIIIIINEMLYLWWMLHRLKPRERAIANG